MSARDENQAFEIVLTHLDGFAELKLRGAFDYAATRQHAETLQKAADLRDRIVIDLGEVAFIDSAGIAFLIRLGHLHDSRIRLNNVPHGVARLLAVTGLEDQFDYDRLSD